MITKNFSVKDLANMKYVRGNRSQLFDPILVVQEGNGGCHSIRKCLCFAISKQKKVRALKCHKCLDLRNCFIQCEDMGVSFFCVLYRLGLLWFEVLISIFFFFFFSLKLQFEFLLFQQAFFSCPLYAAIHLLCLSLKI